MLTNLKIVVARRMMPMDPRRAGFVPSWTWTLYGYKRNDDGPIHVARAEYAWDTPDKAEIDARKFRKLLAADQQQPVPIKVTP